MSKYLDSLASMLVQTRPKMSQDELDIFYSDIKEFINENEDKNASEKANLFFNKYDAIFKDAFYKKLVSIYSTLLFFKIVLIIFLILSPILLFLLLIFSI